MRRVGQQVGALLQRLVHEFQLRRVEVEDGLLEVAHAAVHELGRLAGRAAAKVAALDERDAVAARGRVERGARAGRAAADDEDVEGIVARRRFQAVDLLRARRQRAAREELVLQGRRVGVGGAAAARHDIGARRARAEHGGERRARGAQRREQRRRGVRHIVLWGAVG